MSAKSKINAPTITQEHADYLRQCEFSLEPSVRKLFDLATAAGWTREHTAVSIARIAAQRLRETVRN